MIDLDDLPEGWTLATIADATDDVRSIDPGRQPDQVFSYVDISSIDNKKLEIIEPKQILGADAPSRAKRPIQDGDVLFSNVRTYLRNIARVNDVPAPAVASTGFTLLRPAERVTQDYLFHYVSSAAFISAVTPLQTGSHYPATSDKVVRSQAIPLPPLEVQGVLAELLDQVDDCREQAAYSLARARRALTNFRQAVLAAACSGRLTEDWREAHNGEPLIARLTDARARLRTSKLGRDRLAEPVLDELLEIPGSWSWASIGEVGSVQLGGTPSRKVPEYWGPSTPWVSSGEVANCRIAGTHETITDAGLANSNAKLYPPGTVLIAMIGEGKTRGQAAILDIEATTNQNAAGIIPDRTLIDPEYLWRWALAQYEVTRAVGRGGNQPALNGQKVRELVLPLPPIDEQTEIVGRVDELLEGAKQVQTAIRHAELALDQTGQAALAKAFRGELTARVS